jgi:hypothetical protein
VACLVEVAVAADEEVVREATLHACGEAISYYELPLGLFLPLYVFCWAVSSPPGGFVCGVVGHRLADVRGPAVEVGDDLYVLPGPVLLAGEQAAVVLAFSDGCDDSVDQHTRTTGPRGPLVGLGTGHRPTTSRARPTRSASCPRLSPVMRSPGVGGPSIDFRQR